MVKDYSRVFNYAIDFYFKRIGIIMLFSIPFILAILITFLVPAPSYLALGALFIRTGSLPEFSLMDILITVIGYALSVFIIADTIVNVNLIIKSKRTLTQTPNEIVKGVTTYATRIFFIITLTLLLTFMLQLIIYNFPYQSWIYPLLILIISSLLFFVSPAVVIDNSHTASAIAYSVSLAIKKWHLVAMWIMLGLILLSLVKIISDVIFGSYSSLFVLLVNSLFILPFLIILQTHMYMEKYPLSK